MNFSATDQNKKKFNLQNLQNLKQKLVTDHKSIHFKVLNDFFSRKPSLINKGNLNDEQEEKLAIDEICNFFTDKEILSNQKHVYIRMVQGLVEWSIKGWASWTYVEKKLGDVIQNLTLNKRSDPLTKDLFSNSESSLLELTISAMNQILIEAVVNNFLREFPIEDSKESNKKNIQLLENNFQIETKSCFVSKKSSELQQLYNFPSSLSTLGLKDNKLWDMIFKQLEITIKKMDSIDFFEKKRINIDQLLQKNINIIHFLGYDQIFRTAIFDPRSLANQNVIFHMLNDLSVHFTANIDHKKDIREKIWNAQLSAQILEFMANLMTEMNTKIIAPNESNVILNRNSENPFKSNQDGIFILSNDYIRWIGLIEGSLYKLFKKTISNNIENPNELAFNESSSLKNQFSNYIATKIEVLGFKQGWIVLQALSHYTTFSNFKPKQNFPIYNIYCNTNLVLNLENAIHLICDILTITTGNSKTGFQSRNQTKKENVQDQLDEDYIFFMVLSWTMICVLLEAEILPETQMILLRIAQKINNDVFSKNSLGCIKPLIYFSLLRVSVDGSNSILKKNSNKLALAIKDSIIEGNFLSDSNKLLEKIRRYSHIIGNVGFLSQIILEISEYLSFWLKIKDHLLKDVDSSTTIKMLPNNPNFLIPIICFIDKVDRKLQPELKGLIVTRALQKLNTLKSNKRVDSLVLIAAYVSAAEISPSSIMKRMFLLEALPSLASKFDAFATAELVLISKKLINHKTNSKTKHSSRNVCLGIRMLQRITISNYRAWPDFVSLIEPRFVLQRNSPSTSEEADIMSEQYFTIITCFNEMVRADGEQFSGRVIALLYQKIGRLLDSGLGNLNSNELGVLLNSVTNCVHYGSMNVQAVWIALGLHQHAKTIVDRFVLDITRVSSQKEQSSEYNFIFALIRFLELAPENTDIGGGTLSVINTTESTGNKPDISDSTPAPKDDNKNSLQTSKEEFLGVLLSDFILPLSYKLLFSLEDNSSQKSLSIEVQCSAFAALAKFPTALWIEQVTSSFGSAKKVVDLMCINSDHFGSGNRETDVFFGYSEFLSLLMDNEIEGMRRSVLLGTDRTGGDQTHSFIEQKNSLSGTDDSKKDVIVSSTFYKDGLNNSREMYQNLATNISEKAAFLQNVLDAGKTSSIETQQGLVFTRFSSKNIHPKPLDNNPKIKSDTESSSNQKLESIVEKLTVLLNELTTVSDFYSIPSTLVLLFSSSFGNLSDSYEIEYVFEILKSSVISNTVMPHVRANALYSLGGLVKFLENTNPQLSSAISEQCFAMIESTDHQELLPMNRFGGDKNYWYMFSSKNLSPGLYKDDTVLTSLIYSCAEWSIAMTGNFEKYIQVLSFMRKGLENAFKDIKLFSYHKNSVLACANGILKILDCLFSGISSSSNNALHIELKLLLDSICNFDVFSFESFLGNSGSKEKSFLESDWLLPIISATTLILIKLQLFFGEFATISKNQKLFKNQIAQTFNSSRKLTHLEQSRLYFRLCYLLLLCTEIDYNNLPDDNRLSEFETDGKLDTFIKSDFYDLSIDIGSDLSSYLNLILESNQKTNLVSVSFLLSFKMKQSLLITFSHSLNHLKELLPSFESQTIFNTETNSPRKIRLTRAINNALESEKLIVNYCKSAILAFNSFGVPTEIIGQHREATINSLLAVSILCNLTEYTCIMHGYLSSKTMRIRNVNSQMIELAYSLLGVLDGALGIPENAFNKKSEASISFQLNSVSDLGLSRVAFWLLSEISIYMNNNPPDLKRIPTSSVCRSVWDKLQTSELFKKEFGKSSGILPKSQIKSNYNQEMLWMALLLTKWPFPRVDTTERFIHVFSRYDNFRLKLLAFLVSSKWSAFMYSATRSLIKMVFFTLTSHFSDNDLEDGNNLLVLSKAVLGEHGLGKLLLLGGLSERPSEENYNKCMESDSANVSMHEVPEYWDTNSLGLFSLQEREKLLNSMNNKYFSIYYHYRMCLKLNSDNSSLKMDGMEAPSFEIRDSSSIFFDLLNIKVQEPTNFFKERKPKPHERMMKQMSNVSVPPAIVSGVVTKIVDIVGSSENNNSKSDYFILRQLLTTVRSNNFVNIDSQVDNENSEQHELGSKNRKLQNQGSLSIIKSTKTLKLEISSTLKKLFFCVFGQRENPSIILYKFDELNSGYSYLQVDPLLACMYIETVNKRYEAYIEFIKSFKNKYSSAINSKKLYGETLNQSAILQLFESFAVNRMLKACILCHDLEEKSTDSSGYAVSISISDRYNYLRSGVTASERAISGMVSDIFNPEGISGFKSVEHYEEYMDIFGISVGSFAKSLFIGNILILNYGQALKSDFEQPKSVDSLMQNSSVGLAHLAKSLNIASSGLDILISNISKLINARIFEEKMELESVNDTELTHGISGEILNKKLSMRCLVCRISDIVTVFISKFVVQALYMYIGLANNAHKKMEEYFRNEFNIPDSPWILEEVSNLMDYSFNPQKADSLNSLHGKYLEKSVDILGLSSVGMDYGLETLLPEVLVHYRDIKNMIKKYRLPEYEQSCLVFGESSVESAATGICSKIVSISRLLYYIHTTCNRMSRKENTNVRGLHDCVQFSRTKEVIRNVVRRLYDIGFVSEDECVSLFVSDV
ncbi:hypothetical protein BB558_005073 [Smittium angustum]|uniref:Uncharacterized protein n=1 Tax=Smittium angustum TaxID=133377 RepID=A0A2U1J1N7_SMIAN|nr:hypothetical protein BB558_005073 [Smittium angustum]